MERAAINGIELEVESRGSGEPVLLIHGSIIANAYTPLLREPALAQQYQLVSYNRRGFAGSSGAVGPLSIPQQAADARALLQRLGIERAHVAGHSYGGAIALQLALDAPDVVQSLALLEPGLLMAPSAERFFEGMTPIMQAYESGDKTTAIDGFLQAVCGTDYRAAFEQTLPSGWFEQAVADADTFFQVELPALQEWSFSQELAGRITQPVLSVLGTESAQIFVEIHDLVQQWLPQTEVFVLPGATHGLQLMNPRGMAEGLAGFFVRHPLPVPA
jgi:pimeloyl-ACP methyl ester carboxylesterase